MKPRTRRFRQQGFSVVELMIALTLELVLVAGVTLLTSNTGQNYRTSSGAFQQLENGRFAMDLLKTDLHLTGFFGVLAPSSVNFWTATSSLPDPCDVGGTTILTTLANSLTVPIQGYDNVSAAPVTCITDGIVSGTDVMVIRRADTSTTTVASIQMGTVYIQTGTNTLSQNAYVIGLCTNASSCTGKYGLNDGSTASNVSGTAASMFILKNRDGTESPLRRFHVHIYYIRPWSSSSSESPQIPTLVRMVLSNSGSAPAMVAEPLIEGIENLQIQYGLDNGTNGGITNDGTPDSYAAASDNLLPADWFDMVSVKMSLLARNLEPETAYTDTKVYNLAGAANLSPGGHYRRHAFTSVIMLLNMESRKECRQEVLPAECM